MEETLVRWAARRSWLVVVLAFVAGGVLIVHVAVDRATREPPNYSPIEDGLWLGGRVPAPPPGAKAVLNLCRAEDPYRAEFQRWAPIRDAEPAPQLDWRREQVDFIASQRGAGRTVFVHCRNGVSRSAMVVAAYLMRRDGCSAEEALAFLRSRRPGVQPHAAFRKLLQEWEQTLIIPAKSPRRRKNS
jgi:hypothetical protein